MNDSRLIVVEELLDWLKMENSPEKESLVIFSLGLTQEGKAIRDTVLAVLLPVVEYSRDGNALLIYSRFPRETLLRLAKQAIERMVVYEQIR
jgi:hypothetical protein